MSVRRKSVFVFVLFLVQGLIFFPMILPGSKASFSYAQTEYTASGLKDPFENRLPRPALPPPEKPVTVIEPPKEPVIPPVFTVEGIVSGGPKPQAVVQGKVVRVGDKIGESLITSITKEGVKVIYQGETFIFPAPSKAVKSSQGEAPMSTNPTGFVNPT